MNFYVDAAPAPAVPSIGSYSSYSSTGRNPPVENLRFGATRFLTTKGTLSSEPAVKELQSTSKLPNDRPVVDATLLPPSRKDSPASLSPGSERPLHGKEAEIRKITEDRIRLLAAKYTNESISAEMMARLEILNSRLSERAPRVTAEQISSLENSIGVIKSIEASRLARAKRLGLKI
jgi:hypothetical protein